MNIVEKILPSQTYLMVRKIVPFNEVMNKSLYHDAGEKLAAYIAKHAVTVVGPWTVIYFTWDLDRKETDMGIAFPVSGIDSTSDSDMSIVHIPELKVCSGVLEGPYENLKNGHEALLQYLGEEGYAPYQAGVMALEEYVVGPREERNPELWKTAISYVLHKS